METGEFWMLVMDGIFCVCWCGGCGFWCGGGGREVAFFFCVLCVFVFCLCLLLGIAAGTCELFALVRCGGRG